MSDFLKSIATIIIHTPIWVWPLYGLLLFLGYQRTRDSIVPLWRLLILPAVVTFLTILTAIGAGPGALPTMLLGLTIGGPVGWQLEPGGATRRMRDGRLWLRGEWWTFAQIVVVLVFRYATSIVAATDRMLAADVIWQVSTLFVSAFLSALFLGRTASRLRVYLMAAPAAG